MPIFSEFFIKTKGQPINYKGKTLYLVDKFPVADDDTIIIIFEKTNSNWKQGVSIDITGKCEYMGKLFEKGKGVNMIFWEDTSPKQTELRIFTKKGFVWIKNIWDTGNGTVESWHGGAAMIVEEIENGRRYRCNDGHPDEDFDDIIFTIQRVVK